MNVHSKSVVIVHLDGWEGLYIDGTLVGEGEHITPDVLGRAMGVAIETRYGTSVAMDLVNDSGMPDLLSDLELQ